MDPHKEKEEEEDHESTVPSVSSSSGKFQVITSCVPKKESTVVKIIRPPNSDPFDELRFVGTYVPPPHGIQLEGEFGTIVMDHEDCCEYFAKALEPNFVTMFQLETVKDEGRIGASMSLAIYERKTHRNVGYPKELVPSRSPSPEPFSMSVPEPPPKNGGIPVTKALLEWLSSKGIQDQGVQEAVNLVYSRDAFGRKKYGQCLMSQDGRDEVEDALQEMGDLLQYLYKAKLNGSDISRIRSIVPVLLMLVESINEFSPKKIQKEEG